MNRIDRKFADLRKSHRKAFIAYLTAGYPSLKATGRFARSLETAGVDVLELGVPFSDPIADGPTIQFSSQKALAAGVSLDAILRWVAKFRRNSQLPIVIMSYLNPIHRMGYRAFAKRARQSGVDGLIVPDMIPEESEELRRVLRQDGIDLIFLVAPTTPLERVRSIARRSTGFLYAVSLTGVTGARSQLPADTIRFLDNVRRASPVPVALGFGISKPEQVRRLSPHAGGIIVGSAFIDLIRRGKSISSFAASLRKALDHPNGRRRRT